MKSIARSLDKIAKERPIGSKSNEDILDFIEKEALRMGYSINSLAFDCNVWEIGKSFIKMCNASYEILPSPFSKHYEGNEEISIVHSLEELQNIDFNGKILFLKGQIAKEQLMPKDFPFYYPKEHKYIIDTLEEKNPKAIVAVTSKHPMYGLCPFPLFADGNFSVPSAYIDEETAENILGKYKIAELCIASKSISAKSRQIVASKKAKGSPTAKIIVCAHMDSQYGTPGALDNAAGVVVMLELMEQLKSYDGIYDIDFIPFNGEEYYEEKGELEYLNYIEDELDSIKFVINIDSPCYKNSKTAISTYSFNDELNKKLNTEIIKNKYIAYGEPWYAGDHVMFVNKGIPSIVVSSDNLFEAGAGLDIMHTEKDIIENIDCSLIGKTASFLKNFIEKL